MVTKAMVDLGDDREGNQQGVEQVTETTEQSKIKLDKEVILTVTGSDHESIVQTILEILTRFKGSVSSQQFSRIGNRFAGNLLIAINQMYLQPFISCLESLNAEKIRFEFEILERLIATDHNAKIRFDLEIWGQDNPSLHLQILQLLGQHQLQIESIQDRVKLDSQGQQQFLREMTMVTDYVVDGDEINQELQQLIEGQSMTLLLMGRDMDEDFNPNNQWQEAI